MSVIGPALASALSAKGYTSLTAVQLAVLDPSLAGKDLKITSRTGSGKTVAVGFVLRDVVARAGEAAGTRAGPRALIITPTRELAQQVGGELTWLFTPLHVRVATVTGGADYRAERRALAAAPAVIVGTPGRLLDHLERGAIDLAQTAAVVLDEADRMLDMGFREEIEKILALAPAERNTHLMSATFPQDVQALAARVQRDAVHVEGTRLGEANADIDHVVHIVDPHQRVDAIVNLLLAHPDDDTLIFARTRVDVAELAAELAEGGFSVTSLSGDLEQAARDRALSAFRRGDVRVLVATDVAARGLDVVDIARVIHAEPPGDADTYTHRSGRTGRAGRKGTSSVLVSPAGLRRTMSLLKSSGVSFRFEPIPTAEAIASSRADRLFAELTAPDAEGFRGFDDDVWQLAKRLEDAGETTRLIARLLERAKVAGPTRPREIRVYEPPRDRPKGKRETPQLPRNRREDLAAQWAVFRVSWGQLHGADARRLLAMACRRGGVRGQDVGAIRVGPTFSEIEVRAELADDFEAAAGRDDPRNPRVSIRRHRAHQFAKPSPRPHHRPPPSPGQGADRLPKRKTVKKSG